VCGKPLLGTMAMKLRRCDDCPSDVDVELLDRLKEWRRSAAKEQQVPAYVVFTDATLTAIAEQRPADPSALVAIPGSARASSTATARPCSLSSRRATTSFTCGSSASLRALGEPLVNRLCAPDGVPTV
jgi:hypothetical protein